MSGKNILSLNLLCVILLLFNFSLVEGRPHNRSRSKNGQNQNVINSAINFLPKEVHLPGYRFCGPGTKQERLDRGETGINALDEACKEHDILYKSTDSKKRLRADENLAKQATQIALGWGSSFKERVLAAAVASTMTLKAKMSGGKTKHK